MMDPEKQDATAESWDAEPPRILSNRDRDILLALVDADPEPTEAAKRAAARFNTGYFVGKVYHFQTPGPDPEADAAPHENYPPCAS